MVSPIDLSLLPKPDVIEQLSYETILNDNLVYAATLGPELEELLPSDPAYKLIEVHSYRELLLKQRINEASHANMLAYAKREDLDNLCANFKVTRLVIDAGDPTAIPPVDPTYESDEALLARAILSADGYTTAGSEESYRFHALSADGQVKDVEITSPNPTEIVVVVLSHTGDGTADAALLATVTAALSDAEVRPLGDRLVGDSAQSATIITYTLNASLILYAGADETSTLAAAEAALVKWVTAQHKIGRDITVAGIHAALKVEGVHDVVLNNTVGTDLIAKQIVTDTEAAFCSGITVTAGGVGE